MEYTQHQHTVLQVPYHMSKYKNFGGMHEGRRVGSLGRCVERCGSVRDAERQRAWLWEMGLMSREQLSVSEAGA